MLGVDLSIFVLLLYSLTVILVIVGLEFAAKPWNALLNEIKCHRAPLVFVRNRQTVKGVVCAHSYLKGWWKVWREGMFLNQPLFLKRPAIHPTFRFSNYTNHHMTGNLDDLEILLLQCRVLPGEFELPESFEKGDGEDVLTLLEAYETIFGRRRGLRLYNEAFYERYLRRLAQLGVVSPR